jgi:apolipoprotein D and lipocalin family protein
MRVVVLECTKPSRMQMTTFLALVATASAASLRRQTTSQSLNVTESTWDGECFYPKPVDDFSLDSYLGRWFQVAGSSFGETAGCTCIYAEYTLNENGTVNVLNGCQAGEQDVRIQGIASAADSAYGDAGVFRVQFPPAPPPGDCAGPNYIVQAYEPRWAIVQASNFSTLFLLSRDQNPPEEQIDQWLDVAGRLGTNLTSVAKISQDNCLFT